MNIFIFNGKKPTSSSPLHFPIILSQLSFVLSRRMEMLMILFSCLFVVRGDFSKSCLSKGKVLLCDKVEGNLTCQNVGVKLLNAERLVVIKPKISRVDITSQCLTKLWAVAIVRSGMQNFSDFATFPMVIINRRVCVYKASIDFIPRWYYNFLLL